MQPALGMGPHHKSVLGTRWGYCQLKHLSKAGSPPHGPVLLTQSGDSAAPGCSTRYARSPKDGQVIWSPGQVWILPGHVALGKEFTHPVSQLSHSKNQVSSERARGQCLNEQQSALLWELSRASLLSQSHGLE